VETNAKKRWRTSRVLGALTTFTIFCFLILAFVPNDRNPTAANESLAASSLRTLDRANVAYAQGHPRLGFAARLSDLARGSQDRGRGESLEQMIDPALAAGEKAGYRFTYSSQSTTRDVKRDAYQATADPLVPGRSGRRHFFVDQTGVIRMSDAGPATGTSTVLE
jgi:type IV pilus assembly protein PilA